MQEVFSEVDKEKIIILNCGPRGVKWMLKDDVVDEAMNPIMFTCSECQVTSRGSEEPAHKAKCKILLMNQLGM